MIYAPGEAAAALTRFPVYGQTLAKFAPAPCPLGSTRSKAASECLFPACMR